MDPIQNINRYRAFFWQEENIDTNKWRYVYEQCGFKVESNSILKLMTSLHKNIDNLYQVEIFFIPSNFSLADLDDVQNYIDFLRSNGVFTLVVLSSEQTVDQFSFKSNWISCVDDDCYDIESFCLSLLHLLIAEKLNKKLT